MERIEIAPGLWVELDESRWTLVDGYGVLPQGREVQIAIDLRITTDAVDATNKAEGVLTVRTA